MGFVAGGRRRRMPPRQVELSTADEAGAGVCKGFGLVASQTIFMGKSRNKRILGVIHSKIVTSCDQHGAPAAE